METKQNKNIIRKNCVMFLDHTGQNLCGQSLWLIWELALSLTIPQIIKVCFLVMTYCLLYVHSTDCK